MFSGQSVGGGCKHACQGSPMPRRVPLQSCTSNRGVTNAPGWAPAAPAGHRSRSPCISPASPQTPSAAPALQVSGKSTASQQQRQPCKLAASGGSGRTAANAAIGQTACMRQTSSHTPPLSPACLRCPARWSSPPQCSACQEWRAARARAPPAHQVGSQGRAGS